MKVKGFLAHLVGKPQAAITPWRDIIVKHIYYRRLVGNKGSYFMREDWDNLIILDGCRYDLFEKNNHINGKLEYRISRGSCTGEFLKRNFSDGKFNDTIYITANPLVNYHVPDSFFKIIPVWKKGWHERYGTVLPETVVENTLNVDKEFPHKRLIIHFMQPHYPYIGKRSREKIGYHDGILSRYLFKDKKKSEHTTQLVWNLLKYKKLDKKIVWEAYEENFQIVLEQAEKLIKKFTGKSVITSDHGNLFGERIFPFFIKEYGHPSGIYTKNLLKVPWLICEKGNRKKIKEEPLHMNNQEEVKKGKIKEKLKSLGYID